MKDLYLVSNFIFVSLATFSQGIQSVNFNYSAGFKTIRITDSSRVYKPGTSPSQPFHFRPIELDIWYPAAANSTKDTAMKFVEFVDLLQSRSNSFQNDTVYSNLTTSLIQYINANLQINDASRLSRLRTESHRNATPVSKRFPMIIYQCAYNGMSYENVPLFEQLAKVGFVVVSISSVGRYPGNMSTKPEDLVEQLRDGQFAMRFLRAYDNVDSTKIGVMGYSWGGLASILMAMDDKNISAVLSLDGSEMFYYRDADDENNDFNNLRQSDYFLPKNINAPYFYVESGHKQDDEPADSIFTIAPSLSTEKNYIRFKNATHEDFSVIPSLALENKSETIKCSGLYDTVITCTVNFFSRYLPGNDSIFTETINKLKRAPNIDFNYPVPLAAGKNSSLLKGVVIDALTKQPIAYANLGVPGKGLGTVSQVNGNFQIEANASDTIEVSMIGYENEEYIPRSKKSQCIIELRRKTTSLPEVKITVRASHLRVLGNTTTSHFFNIGLPLKFLGSEIGIVIKPGRKPVLLKSFNFNVSENHLDSAVFRLNIYSVKDGRPIENILTDNIILRVGSEAGPYHIDLNKYKIVLDKDVLISLEWIDGGKSGTERGVLFLSAGLLNTGTWHRKTSLGNWTKAKGLGVGFNVTVQTLERTALSFEQ